MRKLISLIVSLVLVFAVSMPAFVSAQQVVDDDDHNHSEHSVIIEEVFLSGDMLQQAQKMNVIPTDTDIISPMANAKCKHKSYSDWKTIESKFLNPKKFGDCYIHYMYQIRYCKQCHAAFAREKKVQLKHVYEGDWRSKKCIICGTKIMVCNIEDEQRE